MSSRNDARVEESCRGEKRPLAGLGRMTMHLPFTVAFLARRFEAGKHMASTAKDPIGRNVAAGLRNVRIGTGKDGRIGT